MPKNSLAPKQARKSQDAVRLDKWFWHARFFKSRSLASKFCQSGKVRVNGEPIRKAHYMVRLGDTLTFPLGPHVRVIRIKALGARRGPAPEAQRLYKDLQPPLSKAEREAEVAVATTDDIPPPPVPPKRGPGSGRPTKSDRRAIDRLMGRDGGKRDLVGRVVDAIMGRKSKPDHDRP